MGIANAKGEKFKAYIRRHGMAPGTKVKFDVDFEENRGRPFAANWEMADPPNFDRSTSRSGSKKGRRSPSYKKSRRSPSIRRQCSSPSPRRKPDKNSKGKS